MSGPKKHQIEQAERLQQMLLDDFERLLSSGEMSSADRKTLTDLLKANGWSLDPAQIPQGLADKLPGLVSQFDPKDMSTEHPALRSTPPASA